MTRGVRWYLVGSFVLVALIALAGCSHFMLAEREPWRHDAEIACLNSGAVKESPARVRISSISGPGACGADYPLRVSALGESGPLGYTDEAPVPPGAIPNASMPQHWPVTQSSAAPSSSVSSQQLPPLQSGAPQSYPSQPYPQQQYPQRSYPQQSYPPPSATPVGQPLSLNPPGLAPPEDDEDFGRARRPAASLLRRPHCALHAGTAERALNRCRRSVRRARRWSPARPGRSK